MPFVGFEIGKSWSCSSVVSTCEQNPGGGIPLVKLVLQRSLASRLEKIPFMHSKNQARHDLEKADVALSHLASKWLEVGECSCLGHVGLSRLSGLGIASQN